MKCLNCGKEFEAKRKTARFDADKCRVEYSRRQNKPEVVVVEVNNEKASSDTEEPYTVERWKRENPNPPFTPNWVRNGYPSREAAIEDVLRKVRTSQGVIKSALVPEEVVGRGRK